MKRSVLLLCVFLIATLISSRVNLADAQQTTTVYRIGYMSPGPVFEAFRQGLRELGYIEGKNLIIEYRRGESVERFPDLAEELVRLRVDLILAVGVSAVRAAKQATRTIPIVMGNASADPVKHGLVASLASPGANVTGLVDILPNLAGKRVQLLKEIFPKLSRVGHLSVQGSPVSTAHLKATEASARAFRIEVQALQVRRPEELESAFRAAADGGVDALIVVGISFFIPHRQRIVNLEVKHRLPTMHTHTRWVPAGGLMSYTTDAKARYRRAAYFVDKILKGANPADFPVEQPTKFLFELNLKTAKQIGVTIPPSILYRADNVIR